MPPTPPVQTEASLEANPPGEGIANIHWVAHGTDRPIVSSHLGQQSKQLEPPAVPNVEKVRKPVVHHRLRSGEEAVPTRLRVLDLDQYRVLNGGSFFSSTTSNGFFDITAYKNGVAKKIEWFQTGQIIPQALFK